MHTQALQHLCKKGLQPKGGHCSERNCPVPSTESNVAPTSVNNPPGNTSKLVN
jgi:hypothetical protein